MARPGAIEAADDRDAGSPATTTVTSFDDLVRVLATLGEAAPGARFFRQALEPISEFFAAPYTAVDVEVGHDRLHADWGGQGSQGAFWTETLQHFLSESLAGPARARQRMLESRHHELKAAILSAPILDGRGGRIGCLVSATQVADREEARFRLGQLERLAILMAMFSQRPGAEGAKTESEGHASTAVLARVSGYRSRTELAYAITNGIRSRSDCDLVALGLIERRHLRLLAISGTDEIKSRSPGVATMIAAMEESWDAQRALVWPQGSDWLEQEPPRNHRLLKRWSESAGQANVASIPLANEDGAIAVIALRRSGGGPFTPEQVSALNQSCSGYAAALDLVHRANRGLVRHLLESVRRGLRGFLALRAVKAKLIPVAVLALALWVGLGSLPYHVVGRATLGQTNRTRVGAPADGRLESVAVRPGDPVSDGQILCRFDSRELRLEAARVQADLAVAGVDLDRALAEGSTADAAMARARADSLRAALDLLQQRIDAAVVRAPRAGVILGGDLRDRVGDLFAQGSPLFEIGAEDGWRLRIDIDEADLGLVENLPAGLFAARARPETSLPIQVLRIEPRAELREQRNHFVAEAAIDDVEDWMRQGMEGNARLEAGERRVWWIVGRRVVAWLELNFWL